MKDMLNSVFDLSSSLYSHLLSWRGKNKIIFFLLHLAAAQFAVCSRSLYFKLSPFISLPLVAMSATSLLALLSSLRFHCWLAVQAFFGHPSSVSNIRPGWPNFILYWIPPVWIHTHTHTHTNWEPETSACTCPSAFKDSPGTSVSWCPTCTQRPSHAAMLVRNSF